MFSVDQNRLNITKKRVFDNYVKYNWFYERIEIDYIDWWCCVHFENETDRFCRIMIDFDRIINVL